MSRLQLLGSENAPADRTISGPVSRPRRLKKALLQAVGVALPPQGERGSNGRGGSGEPLLFGELDAGEAF